MPKVGIYYTVMSVKHHIWALIIQLIQILNSS